MSNDNENIIGELGQRIIPPSPLKATSDDALKGQKVPPPPSKPDRIQENGYRVPTPPPSKPAPPVEPPPPPPQEGSSE